MKIAQVAPLYESVPPKLYGGTERIVAYLTTELVRQGHDVTLFASGDSRTPATLVPGRPKALRLDTRPSDPLAAHVVMMEMVQQQAARFDIIHFHTDSLHLPLFRKMAGRTVTTLHGRLDSPDLSTLYRLFPEIPLVSISDAQRQPLPDANWVGTVYHGVPPAPYVAHPDRQGDYFAFLGRISPEKRPDRAIELATRLGARLRIAAKVDAADEAYFHQTIEPLLDSPLVEFVGEIGETGKAAFLGSARALLFPIDWPEPFGLVMVEAMVCGTPVIAFRCGSVPEIVEDGVNGFIVDDMEAAVAAARRLPELDRSEVRRSAARRFSAERMVRDYVALYRRLVGDSQSLKQVV